MAPSMPGLLLPVHMDSYGDVWTASENRYGSVESVRNLAVFGWLLVFVAGIRRGGASYHATAGSSAAGRRRTV